MRGRAAPQSEDAPCPTEPLGGEHGNHHDCATWPPVARASHRRGRGFGTVIALGGIPTGIVPTSLYTRTTPILWWNYPV